MEGQALNDTGAATLLADGLTVVAAYLSGLLAVGMVLVVSMALTPSCTMRLLCW